MLITLRYVIHNNTGLYFGVASIGTYHRCCGSVTDMLVQINCVYP